MILCDATTWLSAVMCPCGADVTRKHYEWNRMRQAEDLANQAVAQELPAEEPGAPQPLSDAEQEELEAWGLFTTSTSPTLSLLRLLLLLLLLRASV